MSDIMRIIKGNKTNAPAPRGGTHAGTHSPALTTMPRRERQRVLIVDDEAAICSAVSSALERAGYEAMSTVSGDSAHEMLRTYRFDALVLDLRVPDMRGDVIFHLAAALQPHLARATMFLTGDVTPEGRRMIAECNAPLVRKPYVVDALIDTVAALCPLSREEIA